MKKFKAHWAWLVHIGLQKRARPTSISPTLFFFFSVRLYQAQAEKALRSGEPNHHHTSVSPNPASSSSSPSVVVFARSFARDRFAFASPLPSGSRFMVRKPPLPP
jgi:hypothetical protein